jgi:CRISPR-associated protein Cas2
MRNRYLVTYDIRDEKRLPRVFRKMRGFGEHVQYSVFICELSQKEKVIMIDMLNQLIKHDEDRIMIINIGSAESDPADNIQFLGCRIPLPDRQAVII